jgi:hypothetical protein
LRPQVEILKRHRDAVRSKTKIIINSHFGSVFRTWSKSTLFFYNLCRYSDIYTSNITNLHSFSTSHTFYAPRQYFGHEAHLPTGRENVGSTD